MSATLSNPSAIETVWAQLHRIHPTSTFSPAAFSSRFRQIYLRFVSFPIQPPASRRTATTGSIRVFFDRPITSGFTLLAAAIPRYLGVRCYGQPHVISALPYCSRSAILFLSFSHMPRHPRDLWKFYLPRARWEVHRNAWFVEAICDRPRENCEWELRQGMRRQTEEKKLRESCENTRKCENLYVVNHWSIRVLIETVWSRVSVMNNNKVNTYIR